MRKKYLLSLLISFVSLVIFAQGGEVSGKLVDENGEAIPFANISIVENGVPTGTGSTTDFDGFYSIKPLRPGKYDVKFSFIGYTSIIKAGVLVKNDKTTYLDQKLTPSAQKVEEVVVLRYKIPLIDAGATSTATTMTSEDIQNLATRNVSDIASTTAGVKKDADGEISIRGSRSDGVVYYVDGIRVNGKVNLPVTAVEQIDVVTGGVPAKFGEATGGVVNIATKGGARKFTGGIEILSSLDQYRWDLINVNLAGPIIKDKAKEKTILGFAVNLEYNRKTDPSPSAVDMYKVKDDKLKEIQEHPLFLDDEVIKWKAEELTFDDLEKTGIKPNTVSHAARANLKFDVRLSDNMKLSIGGNGNFDLNHRRIDRYSLLNYENNPQYTTQNYRGFIRFTHNLKKKMDEEGNEIVKGAIQNGFYQIQAGYEKYHRVYEDDSHGDNSFAYGYIGDFKTDRTPTYSSADGYWNLVSFSNSGIIYKPGTENEYGSAFTTDYYELLGATKDADGYYHAPEEADINGIDDLNSSPALVNGKRAEIPYDLWYNTGRQYNGHGIDNNNDQFSATINGGFDILKKGAESRNKHSINLGFTFEQRINRKYTVSPLPLWDIAQRNVNSHLVLNNDEDYLIENGDTTLVTEFYAADTIFHFYMADGSQNQSAFDRNLRKKIGASNTEWLDVNSLPLETFSVDMFSADELLNDGINRVTYRGYDAHGNLTNDNTTFADFWTQKNDDGDFTRPIAAFQPIYMAGYIEDKFQLKDLTFRVGVRVDRFDANQSVLRDPYSIVGSQTVGDARDLVSNSADIPGSIKDDFVIYVDRQIDPNNPDNKPKALGYRSGDQWYDAEGQPVRNSNSIAGAIAPLLPTDQAALTTDHNFKPELAFKDYEAQYTVMPRLQFSFNISDNALFFAHYDVLAQSPQSRIRGGFFTNRSIGTPLDYYHFNSVGAGAISNPNLKAETTIDFQLGFKQKLNKSSALTFSTYFKEFKNQIQIRRYEGVYPNPGIYYSYDNIDFGTTKGFEFGYELRRTNNLKFNVNYTLQFADGTGSDDRTQAQVVQNSQENFRTVSALDNDSRHNFNVIVDYRFGEGDDYNGPTTKKGAQILSNFGINLLTQLSSGTPFTKQVRASEERAVTPGRVNAEGAINGSRIGWNINADLKINKSFVIDLKSKKEGVEDKALNFDVYLRADNILGVFGVKNVISVYKYTGSAEDDGWLGSSEGEVSAISKANPQSYKDLYNAGVIAPGNYSSPTRLFLGASVFF